MKLSKLEIKGFKSFGDKVTFHFDDGITGIVGPNGCGKSNVVDSIRWVLGEQKTSALRSDKMENVIFNGTSNRKAQQLAEVSMTFLNTKNILPTEYSEVTITRRYYRSGESEYLLNGVTCRLKDITNLFLDTGIGPDSYAIIELKMVEQILNNKDNSRTELFQEAAGISKFKIRKKQTLKKLDDTKKDLDRVEDLLYEIEKNMRSLERQAKQAEQYFKLKEEYKSDSIKYAKIVIDEFQDSFQELTDKINNENDKKTLVETQIKTQQAELEKVKTSIVDKEKLLSSRQKALNEHVTKVNNYEREKAIKNQRLVHLTERKDKIVGQLEEDRKSNERAKHSIETLSLELEGEKKILSEFEQVVTELKDIHDTQKEETEELTEQVNMLQAKISQKKEEVYQIAKNKEISEVQLNSLKQELESTKSDGDENQESLKDFQVKIDSLAKDLNIKKDAFEGQKEREEQLKADIEVKEKHIEEVKVEIAKTSRSLDSTQNEYNLTKSFVENLEGYPEAVKFLVKSDKEIKKAPLLSDIITTEEKYRLPIENYLEPYMNYFILEDEDKALNAVQTLSNSGNGKANFFILNKFASYVPKQSKSYENCVSVLDVLEYDETHAKLIHFLLDGVYLVINDQDKLPKPNEDIFITLNGKYIKRRYSISGGSVGLFEGKRIGRAKNVEKLEKEIKKISEKLNGLNKALEGANSELQILKESQNSNKLEQLREEIDQLNHEYISYKTRDEQLREMISSQREKREVIIEKIAHLEEDLKENSPKLEEETEALKLNEEQYHEFSEILKEKNEVLSKYSANFNENNIQYYQKKNKVESIEQELGYKKDSFEASKQRIESNKEELTNLEAESKNIVTSSELDDDTFTELYEEKDAITQGVREVEEEYYKIRNQVSEIEEVIRDQQQFKQKVDDSLLVLNEQMSEHKVNLASIRERMNVEFEINIDQTNIAEEEYKDLDKEEVKEKLEKAKTKIERIGPINPMAMEAYNEVKERYDFYITQKLDLEEAKNSLMDTIDEIEEKAREEFIKSFELVRENFKNVFRTLFTQEDKCDLILVDEDNPTESPIEIIAQPKGKRPLTINQLSGGEKTLTAVSLLFAIYLLKPAPFCIFDEVDAPLDDTNIDKFNNIIREFSNESQFIIVTHNKRTMASTDVIYGVTMIEKGVSTAIPADLRDIEMEQ